MSVLTFIAIQRPLNTGFRAEEIALEKAGTKAGRNAI